MMLNLSVNFMGFYILCNFHWVQIDMNHALPHFLMTLPLPRFIYTLLEERVGMNQYKSYTRIILIISLQLSEMTIVSMRTVWTYLN